MMNDVIYIQEAIDRFEPWLKVKGYNEGELNMLKVVLDELKCLPAAEPEIIKCKDCLHWVRTCGDNQWGLGDCDVFDIHLVMCEGYCAWAERRSDE